MPECHRISESNHIMTFIEKLRAHRTYQQICLAAFGNCERPLIHRRPRWFCKLFRSQVDWPIHLKLIDRWILEPWDALYFKLMDAAVFLAVKIGVIE